MNLKWTELRATFGARPRRERGVLIALAVMLVLALGHTLWIEPARARQRMLEQRLAEQRTTAQALAAEWDTLRIRQRDPDAGRKAQVSALREGLARLDAEFSQMQQSLVAPREMGGLIKDLLAQHGGLQLLALRNLPVVPLTPGGKVVRAPATAGATAANKAPAPPAAAASANAEPEAWLYMHGMQITVQGSYADMQAYLESLERLPRRLLWGGLKIDAQAWPASVMTITIYTVSLERTWWSV